jgi:hypothetical protein
VRQLLVEADKADSYGKPLAAALMRALARVLPGAGRLFDCLECWPGDLASDGVVFRLNAGLHALALAGEAGALARLYGVAGPPELLPARALDHALAAVLHDHSAALLAWLAHPTQTNEVARVAGLVAALLELGDDRAMPSEVLELGASAGLNLNFPHYAVSLAGQTIGPALSAVRIAPQWRGRAPRTGPLRVTATRGVDLHPLDAGNPHDCRKLMACIWPGDTERRDRLEAALGVAQRHPPQLAAGLASAWLMRALAAPQPQGVRRVVFHAMVLQYAPAGEKAAIDAAFALGAAHASPDRPLARVSMEWRADRSAVELRIAQWDGRGHHGQSQLAAICHPYGAWIDWRGLG